MNQTEENEHNKEKLAISLVVFRKRCGFGCISNQLTFSSSSDKPSISSSILEDDSQELEEDLFGYYYHSTIIDNHYQKKISDIQNNVHNVS